MRVVIQRVRTASVSINEKEIASIGNGILIFLGITNTDTEKIADILADKIANLRIFEDQQGKMNLSALDIKAELLIVSQFTIYGDTKKGRRPSFTDAALPDKAEPLYEYFVNQLKNCGMKVQTGKFQEKMMVSLENDGPVTFIVESN